MSSRQLDEERIFHVARDISNPETRSEYLDQVCAGDQALRERVEALLAVHQQEQNFLVSDPAAAPPTEDRKPLTERPGTMIGRYKLMEQIGEGGMGVVFVAEQERPIRRKVALKVIKPGMDSKAVVARFEAERQALAMMDHPNIAKVLDAGTTDTGRPYFAMELVKGIPITEYCDQNRLTISERLELFIQVCHAIQHAHQKGIIHRDIKPSNVLVTLLDGKPVPKVIDFGVAKALNARLTDQTLYTEHFQVIGTLLYMSPEQAALSGLDVDTRSDIYSLGVLLYELLTGTTPFQRNELSQAGFDEQRRIVSEAEPPRASVRLSSLGDTATSVAALRRTDPKRLNQLVRGDLDWIVLKALEKERARRYESSSTLANDIERYMNDEEVFARPPSPGYRLMKFSKRNKGAVISSLFVIATLFIGIMGTTWQAMRANAKAVELKTANDSLEMRNLENHRMLRELNDDLFFKTLTAIFNGDESADGLIEKAERLRLADHRIRLLRNRLLMNQGKMDEAIDDMVDAIDEPDCSVALQASLATTFILTGYDQEYREIMDRLQTLVAISHEDKLCLAQANVFSDPAAAMRLARESLEERESYFAHVVLAEACTHHASETGNRDSAKQAITEISAAITFMPDSAMVISTYLFSNLVSARIAEQHQESNSEFLDNARIAVQDLEDHLDYPMGRHLRGLFYDYIDKPQLARKEFEAAVNSGAVGVLGITYAAFLYRDGKLNEAFEVLERLGDNRKALALRAQLLAMNQKTHHRVANVVAQLDTSSDHMRIPATIKMAISSPEVAYMLCGKRDLAEDLAGRRLSNKEYGSEWERLRLEIICGNDKAEELLRKSRPSNSQMTASHKFLGLIAISQEQYEEALDHLRQAREMCWFWPDAFIADAIRIHVESLDAVSTE